MDNYFDHIEDFISGQLSKENRQSFETEMAINEQLEFAVKEHQLLYDVQDVLIEEDIQSSIDKVRSEMSDTKLTSQSDHEAKRIWLKPLSIAASVAILLGLGYFVLQGLDGNMSGSEIYALTGVELHDKYFRKPVDSQVRGVINTDTSQEEISEVTQKPCDVAHELMTDNKYRAALDAFKNSLDDSEDLCKWKSEFYSALIYAILGEREQAKKELDPIIQNPTHGYHNKAKELLLDLD